MNNFLRVEPFDLMQYFYRSAHDPIIHAVVRTSGRIEVDLLGKAFLLSTQTVPVIGCAFLAGGKSPRWEPRRFTEASFVQLLAPEPDAQTAERLFLTSALEPAAGPQVKAGVIRNQGGDTLCVLINHMVCDGGGFKEYLYLICRLYNSLCEGASPDIPSPVARSVRPVFAAFGLLKRMSFFLPPWDIPSTARQGGFPLEGDRAHPFICAKEITPEGMNVLKQRARENGATINDMLLTAYVRVLCRGLTCSDIMIPCPADLNKYLPAGSRRGICNLTTNYLCNAHIEKDDPFETTLGLVSAQMRSQKESDACLKPVRLLCTLFRLIPFSTLQKSFHRFFAIPVISYTNLGILDQDRLRLRDAQINSAFLTGAIKYVPYFQIAASTYRDTMTLTCNLHGTPADRVRIEQFLQDIADEMKRI